MYFSFSTGDNCRSLQFLIESSVPSDVLSSLPSDFSSDVPSVIPAPVVDAPSISSPSGAPSTDSMPPSTFSSSVPSDMTSDSPSVVPAPVIDAPSISSPNVAPPTEPSPPAMATERVTVKIGNVKITFTGVETISSTDALQLQIELEIWFENFFNEEQEMEQRYLLPVHQQHDHRTLQKFRVQNVRNMESTYSFMTQDTATFVGSNIVSFTQSLTYNTVSEAGNPNEYIMLPFMDTLYKDLLLEQLKTNVDSFLETTAISTPIISESSVESKGLSIGTIVGVVVGAIVGLLLVAGLWRFFLKQNIDRRLATNVTGVHQTTDNRTQTMGEGSENIHPISTNVQGQIPPTTASTGRLIEVPPPQPNNNKERRSGVDPPAQTSRYEVTYKDQSRSVTGPTQTVQAIVHPRSDSSTLLPLATAVPLKT